MYRPSLKPVGIGIIIGVMLLAIPFFLLKALLFFLVLGAIFRLASRGFFRGRHRRGGYASYGLPWHPAFADTIRSMSEEDYGTFRQQLTDRPYAAGRPRTTIEIQ